MVSVGELIRRRRLSLGLTQEQLCEMTDLDQQYLSQVERGKIKRPDTPILRRLSRALDLPEVDLMRAAGLVVEVVTGGADTAWIELRGRVPADSIRWTEMNARGQSVEIPQAWADAARSPLFAITVTGDCLARLGVVDGDVVVCETHTDVQVKAGTIVLVRVDNEYALKAYHRVGPVVELRDGDGNVVRTLSQADDYTILGTYFARFDGRLANVRS